MSVITQHLSDRVRRNQVWARRLFDETADGEGHSDDDSGEEANIEGSEEDNYRSADDAVDKRPITRTKPHEVIDNKMASPSEDKYDFGFDQDSRLGANATKRNAHMMSTECPRSVHPCPCLSIEVSWTMGMGATLR
jgi:hypothetical protein